MSPTQSELNLEKIIKMEAKHETTLDKIDKFGQKLDKIHDRLFLDGEDGSPCMATKMNICFGREQVKNKLFIHGLMVLVGVFISSAIFILLKNIKGGL